MKRHRRPFRPPAHESHLDQMIFLMSAAGAAACLLAGTAYGLLLGSKAIMFALCALAVMCIVIAAVHWPQGTPKREKVSKDE